jgi:hypothetical protein
MKFQIPKSKLQRNSNRQVPNWRPVEGFESWNLNLLWSFDFGAWNL